MKEKNLYIYIYILILFFGGLNEKKKWLWNIIPIINVHPGKSDCKLIPFGSLECATQRITLR